MLAKTGLEHNRNWVIVKRIFAEEFRVVYINPTLGRYVIRLNQFYEQIQCVGNNYSQVAKAINTYSRTTCCPARSTRWWPARAS